jgi:hypothetical protein
MFSRDEQEEIRQFIYTEMAAIERHLTEHSGTYSYLCRLEGVPVFTHAPQGTVLRHLG